MDNENKNNENKFDNFDFNKVIRKPQPVVNKPSVVVEAKKVIEIEKPVKKITTSYKYGKVEFKNLNDLHRYLLINYYKIGKIATQLLNDLKFRKWLQVTANDVESYNEWLNKIL
ncbi:MAG: hypothetical protein K0Q49_1408 [Haloplasmataceae bacterium]|jgi:hypothetical protein|nr:hypothetical protein [Haloplasmataceae bacterium]